MCTTFCSSVAPSTSQRWADDMKIAGLFVAILFVLTFSSGLGYWIGKRQNAVETSAPSELQSDGSILAERKPDPNRKSKHRIPKGATVERVGEIIVRGETPAANVNLSGAEPCPPVTIDTTLVREPDGAKRLIVSSPDGEVDRAVDTPIQIAESVPAQKPWAAGISFDPIKQTPGAWLERDFKSLGIRLGAEINQIRTVVGGPVGSELRFKAGLIF